MTKIIKLTESDLTRIVRKVISEQALPEYDFENLKPGKLVQGDKNGKGVLKWSNAKYYGELKNGLMDGKGSLYIDELSYKVYIKGEFKNNRQNGSGECKFSDGETHKGNYKDGYMNGYGEIIKPYGSIYKGNFKYGFMNGYGEYKYSDGATFKGNFKDDYRNGYGIYTNQHGIKFEGQFKEGVLNGKGLEELDKIKTQPKEPSKQQPKTIKLPNLSDKNYYTLEGDKSWVYTKLDDGKWYASKNKIDWYDITNNRKAVETLNKSAKITNIEDTKLQPTVEPTPNLTTTDPNKAKMSRYSPTSDLETGTDIINNMRNKGKIQPIDKTFDKKLGI